MNEIFAWIMGVAVAIVPSFGETPPRLYHGYVEADYVYAAPASAGRIEVLDVGEGETVVAGTLLFALESVKQQASLRAAVARETVAEATWRNMETGSRVEEVEVIRASLSKAKADQALAEVTLERSLKLNALGVAPAARVDSDRATLERANAQLAQLQAQLNVSGLPARDAQLVAAEASLTAARADSDRARSDLADREILAPVGGVIERVYFRAGEVAPVGVPVVALLPPGELKARFFIPEVDRVGFHIGDVLMLTCDGCAEGLVATISHMASDPQHTPPIIYSRDERARLVFMAEARIDDASKLLPGQPVTLQVVK